MAAAGLLAFLIASRAASRLSYGRMARFLHDILHYISLKDTLKQRERTGA